MTKTKKAPRAKTKARRPSRLEQLESLCDRIRRQINEDCADTTCRLDANSNALRDVAKKLDEHADGVLKHARAVDERLTQHEKHFDDLEEDLERRYTNDGCADLVARFHALEARLSMPGLVDILTARLDLAEARVAALELNSRQALLKTVHQVVSTRTGKWVSWLRAAPGVRDSLSR